MGSPVGNRDRKLLWSQSDRCAFPGCDQALVLRGPTGEITTPVGVECHIVAQHDNANIARAPQLLTDDERGRHAELIADRHSERNLVLLCSTHSTLIDDPAQDYSVDQVLGMKVDHLAAVKRERELGQRIAEGELSIEQAARDALIGTATAIAEDTGAWEHKAMTELLRMDANAATWLLEQLGSPEDTRRLQALVEAWPVRVAQGRDELAIAVARKAERHRRYDLASTVWERLGDRAGDPAVGADRFARAAVDASIDGDSDRENRLLEESEKLDPKGVRARLQRLDENEDPEETLRKLDDLSADEPTLQALIELQRARSHMLLTDLLAAEASLSAAERLDPGAVHVRSLSVNLRIQRARIGVRDDIELSLADSRAAKEAALVIRGELIALGRYTESMRMLMLAADADAVERDPARAAATLRLATEQEITAPDAPEVLGDAALRAVDHELALRFTEAGHSETVRRIRATAQLDGLGAERTSALRELEEMAVGGGPEGEYAAAARLMACLDGTPFHEPSAATLLAGPHARIAHTMRAYAAARAGDHAAAERVIKPFGKTRWGAEAALRLAAMRGNQTQLRDTARAALNIGADLFGRYEAGLGLARAGLLDEATGVLGGVARSPNAPERLRYQAYNKLLRLCSDRDAWDEAGRAWDEWRDLLNTVGQTDGRLSAWQVRVTRHRGHTT